MKTCRKIAIFLQAGEGVQERKSLKYNYSKVLWDITTKFLPVKDLLRSQLFTKFYGYSLKNGAAMPLTIWNFSRAWQAYFLSNNLQIWWENTSFNDLQMIWNSVFDTSLVSDLKKSGWATTYISIAYTWSVQSYSINPRVVGCGAIFKIDAWKVALYIEKLRDKLKSK